MVTSVDCIKKYGTPSAKSKWLQILHVPNYLQYSTLPNRIFCNYDFHAPYLNALELLHERDCISEIKTFDGVFNIRRMRNASAYSLHSWAIAIDLNAFQNQMYTKGKWSKEFIKCFTDAGFDYGGHWKKRTDPMHFQLSNI